MYDLIIKNGTVVDGTGAPRFKADIAVADGKIKAIASKIECDAKQTIDAEGLIVAPGFIDWHSHSDISALMCFGAPNVLQQGVTLEITGHCGVSAAPVHKYKIANVGIMAKPELMEKVSQDGGGFAAYIKALKSIGLPTNIACFVGHGSLRAMVMGFENREPTESEMLLMKQALREAMEAGAMGMSTGLIYPPGSYSKPRELIELARVSAEYSGAMYTTHLRNEGDYIAESVQEALELGREANIPVVISHHKISGRQNKGKSDVTLRLIDEAKLRGQEVYLDAYPYDGGSTSLTSSLPPRFAADGPAALIEKLQDPSIRAEITGLLKKPGTGFENLIYSTGFERVLVGSDVMLEINGKNLLELANEAGKDVYENMYDLLVEAKGQIIAIYRMICEWDMENILRYAGTMMGTDGAQSAECDKFDHPRGSATYPRLIGTFCRDKGFYTLEECIHRFTGKAAAAAGFGQKGVVAAGKDADLVVFDFGTISGNADYGAADVPNEGIEYVFVNGVMAVRHGEITGAKGGKAILRGGVNA